jgi:sensor histidine kinase YesM
MLFIPFIENAFKHAGNKKIENAINIRFIIENKKITFECENNCTSDNIARQEGGGVRRSGK